MRQPVSTHSRPKAAGGEFGRSAENQRCFNTQPPEGGCQPFLSGVCLAEFQHTAARRRLARLFCRQRRAAVVSTHSRPKAAGTAKAWRKSPFGFNTQPPEGGWVEKNNYWLRRLFQHTAARRRLAATPAKRAARRRFQHTAARRRLTLNNADITTLIRVSTHSRPKAAVSESFGRVRNSWFQHTAARRRLHPSRVVRPRHFVSTHSRPKAAGDILRARVVISVFQHTAARRRLHDQVTVQFIYDVSTHSRPKAAGATLEQLGILRMFQHTAARRRLRKHQMCQRCAYGFNTQPPEGGCPLFASPSRADSVSTHSRPKAAGNKLLAKGEGQLFQHTAARRRLC